MSETTNRKQISTLLDRELHKQAQIKDIKWSEALDIGVRILLNKSTKKVELEAKKRDLMSQIAAIDTDLAGFEAKEKEVQDIGAIARKHIYLLSKASHYVNEDIKRLEGWTNQWNRDTLSYLSKDDFWKLIQRYVKGEFSPKKEPKKEEAKT